MVLYSEHVKNSQNSIFKKRMEKRLEQNFTTKDTWMINKYMTYIRYYSLVGNYKLNHSELRLHIYQNSYNIKNCSYHVFARMQKSQNVVGGSMKGYSHFGRKLAVLLQVKHIPTICSSHFTLRYLAKRNENIYLDKNLYMNMSIAVSFNKLKMIQAFFNR